MEAMRRGKATMTLSERLLKFAEETRRTARLLPPGDARETLLRKARQAEATANIEKWISSPGLRPPV
ncbi:hypothetical protein QCM77_45035 [Bradyrhizobium sp. SSUT18]|nr:MULTISPECIES: hypothetical protein [unclassified Bradyrhizobium]MDH2348910.1 hypothetical protein [Bradyrhizobium sp. SSUT77]MDH2406938.1 hypothetical protein [Bradyrhizobium sp. SSUT18]